MRRIGKAEARKAVTEWLRDGDFQSKEKTVRINPLDSLWGFADLEETMSYAPDCYVVPKPESLEDLDVLDRELARPRDGRWIGFSIRRADSHRNRDREGSSERRRVGKTSESPRDDLGCRRSLVSTRRKWQCRRDWRVLRPLRALPASDSPGVIGQRLGCRRFRLRGPRRHKSF